MLEELLKEIKDLKEYKNKYDYAIKDKQRMSDLLFELMTEKYNNTSYEDRKTYFKNNVCSCCKYKDTCFLEITENIGKPIKSNNAWIPATKSCKEFEWN